MIKRIRESHYFVLDGLRRFYEKRGLKTELVAVNDTVWELIVEKKVDSNER